MTTLSDFENRAAHHATYQELRGLIEHKCPKDQAITVDSFNHIDRLLTLQIKKKDAIISKSQHCL
jgi:hypothetical protein